MTAQDSRLVNILQLKYHLRTLRQQGQVSAEDTTMMQSALEQLAYSIIEPLHDEFLSETVEKILQENPQINLSPLDRLFKQQRHAILRDLRQSCINKNLNFIDASNIINDIDEKIPLKDYSWQVKQWEFKLILDELIKEPTNNQSILDKISRFFETKNSFKLLLGLPEFAQNTIRNIHMNRLILPENTAYFHDDVSSIRNQLRDHETQLRQLFSKGGIKPEHNLHGDKEFYHLLNKETVSPRSQVQLADLVLLWQGPGFHELALRLLGRKFILPRTAEVFLARTGIDISESKNELKTWAAQGSEKSSLDQQQLVRLIESNQILYNTLQILALSDLTDNPQATRDRWLPIAIVQAKSFASEPVKKQELTTPITEDAVVATQRNQEEATKPIPKLETSSADIDNLEEFYIPDDKTDEADRLVEKHSNWNEYVKPFLSENWLGLIGIGFIMAAWPILSMMVWNKGEFYRMAAGAIPLLCVTLGSAWICQFFANYRSKSSSPESLDSDLSIRNRKPAQLFACLTTWTIPFNILMAISMLHSGQFVMTGLMLVIYALAIWRISPWLSPSFGYSPKNYLLLSHSLLLIPAISQLISPNALSMGMAALVYLAFFYYAKTLSNSLSKKTKGPRTFLSLLTSVHVLLAITATHIYYVRLPDPGTIAILAQLVALSIVYFKRSALQSSPSVNNKQYLIVIAGGIAVFGNLLAITVPAYLLITLVLSGVFWASMSKMTPAKWPLEIIAIHVIAYVAAINHNLAISSFELLILSLSAGIAIWFIENKFAKHDIKLLSLGIPIGLLVGSWFNSATGIVSALSLLTCLILAALNYRRCSNRCQTGLWYLAVAVMIILPVIYWVDVITLPSMAIYIAGVTAMWGGFSKRLTDYTAQLHRTSLLWGLTAIASSFLIYVAIDLNLEWNATWYLACLFCVYAAIIAGKRTQSLLPIYLAGGLFGLGLIAIKHNLEILSKSGIGSASIALILILLAPRLQGMQFFSTDNKTDRFFNRNFYFRSHRYLQLALEQLSWGFIAISIYKSILLFAPTLDNFKLSIASLISFTCLLILSYRYQRSWIAVLAYLPLVVLVCALCASLPLSYNLVFLLALILAFGLGVNRYAYLSNTPYAVIHRAAHFGHKLISIIFIPATLIAYIYMLLIHVDFYLHIAFGIMSLVYTQKFFIKKNRHYMVHFNLVHISIMWALFLLFIQPDITKLSIHSAAIYLLSLSSILFILAYGMEWSRAEISRIYHTRIQRWLISGAFLVFALLILSQLEYKQLPASILIASLILFHAANRAYHYTVLLIFKLLAWSMLAFITIDHYLYAAMLSCLLFLSFELMLHHLNKIKLLQIQGIGDNWDTPLKGIAYSSIIALVMIIAVHLTTQLGIVSDSYQAYTLFGLLPLGYFLYKTLNWKSLSYALPMLFTYVIIFIALEWKVEFYKWGLTNLHMLSGALVISVISLTLAGRLLPLGLSDAEEVQV